MMDEKRFEELWERAEANEYATKLAAEFPAWRAARRRTAGIVTGMALTIAVAAPLAFHPHSSEHIYCNNSSYSDSYWTETASALLLEA